MEPEKQAQTELQTLTKQLNALYELICAQKHHAQTGITVADKQEKYAESVGNLIGEERAQRERTRRVQEEITLHHVLSKLKRIGTINPDIREEEPTPTQQVTL